MALATAGGGGDGKFSSTLTECSICFENFVDPKVIKCGHTFCDGCVRSMIKNDRLTCPTCREEMDVPRNGFPTNYFAVQAIEDYEKIRKLTMKCSECATELSMKDAYLCKHLRNGSIGVICVNCYSDRHEGARILASQSVALSETPPADRWPNEYESNDSDDGPNSPNACIGCGERDCLGRYRERSPRSSPDSPDEDEEEGRDERGYWGPVRRRRPRIRRRRNRNWRRHRDNITDSSEDEESIDRERIITTARDRNYNERNYGGAGYVTNGNNGGWNGQYARIPHARTPPMPPPHLQFNRFGAGMPPPPPMTPPMPPPMAQLVPPGGAHFWPPPPPFQCFGWW